MRILGLSAVCHDSAACLVEDGTIAAAEPEERFSRRKHDVGFPSHAIAYTALRNTKYAMGYEPD